MRIVADENCDRLLLAALRDAQVADLHLWRVGPGHRSLIVSLVSPDPLTAELPPVKRPAIPKQGVSRKARSHGPSA